MATVGANAVTLADYAKRLAPDGKIARIIEILRRTDAMLDDMLWMEGNLETGHKTTIRTGYPASTWRMLNYGVQPSKSTTAQVTDTCGMLEQYGEIDCDLAKLNGNSAAFLMSENQGHIEGLARDLQTALIYSNQATDPSEITGFAPRYNHLSTDPENIGYNVLNGGGTESANTSVYMIGWGDDSIAGIYPKGSQAGLLVENLGIETKEGSGGLLSRVFRSHYQWKPGLSVRNWKQGVRIANIDVGDLTTDASAGAKLMELFTTAYYRLQDRNRPVVYYGNTTICEYLHHQAVNKGNAQIRLDEVDGKPVVMWLGNPVREVEAIINTEDVVS